jgi:hypothetical protein
MVHSLLYAGMQVLVLPNNSPLLESWYMLYVFPAHICGDQWRVSHDLCPDAMMLP